jgi:hypothetical protein
VPVRRVIHRDLGGRAYVARSAGVRLLRHPADPSAVTPIMTKKPKAKKADKKADKAPEAAGARTRADKRVQLLTYMAPETVIQLKTSALQLGRPAYELVEEAVKDWLKSHKRN